MAWMTLCQVILKALPVSWWEDMPPEHRDDFRDSPRKKRPKQSAQARLLIAEIDAQIALC